jgi:hypothetical protein
MTAPRYQPYYCEENAWHLCLDPRLEGATIEVALITNATRSVALWNQRAAASIGAPVVWDYHVMLFAQRDDAWSAWDLDTTLDFPEPAERWLDATFHRCAPILQPHFQLLAADDYRTRFASDRRHMRDELGEWTKPPPPWPTIGEGHTLPDLLDVDRGAWLTLTELRARYSLLDA